MCKDLLKTRALVLSLTPEAHLRERHLPPLPSNAASRSPIHRA